MDFSIVIRTLDPKHNTVRIHILADVRDTMYFRQRIVQKEVAEQKCSRV